MSLHTGIDMCILGPYCHSTPSYYSVKFDSREYFWTKELSIKYNKTHIFKI